MAIAAQTIVSTLVKAWAFLVQPLPVALRWVTAALVVAGLAVCLRGAVDQAMTYKESDAALKGYLQRMDGWTENCVLEGDCGTLDPRAMEVRSRLLDALLREHQHSYALLSVYGLVALVLGAMGGAGVSGGRRAHATSGAGTDEASRSRPSGASRGHVRASQGVGKVSRQDCTTEDCYLMELHLRNRPALGATPVNADRWRS